MKYILLIAAILVAGCCLWECKSQKEITYDLPVHLAKTEKQKIIKDFEKGKILFKAHCAECHGIFVNGKETVPDFSKPQIFAYHAIFMTQVKALHKSANSISPLQLDYVLTFLTYKKMENPTPKK